MKLESLVSSYENDIYKAEIKSAIKVVKRICELYPEILKVQPYITEIHTGMGAWTFNGYGVATSTDEECKGEEVKIDDTELGEFVVNGTSDYIDMPINKSLIEIAHLLNFLIGEDGLNCSTWQDGFNEKGIIFRHSETSNQSNPFSIPNKKYFTDDDYYKKLVKAGVPVIFIEEKKK
jgi:hypothetical protein